MSGSEPVAVVRIQALGGCTITIGADDVSLDLNGFTVTPVSAAAISVSNRDNVRIFNGTIAGGDGAGIAGSGMGSIFISDLQLLDITGDCIDLNNPLGILIIERIRCHRATRGGIFIRQFLDLPLNAVVRDNVISNVSRYGCAASRENCVPSSDGSWCRNA